MDEWVAQTDTLLKSALAGNEQAWGEFARLFNRKARLRLQYQFEDRTIAEDILQTVWMQFYESVRTQAPDIGWGLFARILERRIIDAIRKKGRNREFAVLNAPIPSDNGDDEELTHLDMAAADEPDVAEMIAEAEEHGVLHRVLNELPAHHRFVIRARYIERRPFKEIAPMLVAAGLMDETGDGVKRAQEYAYRALGTLEGRLTAAGITRGRKSR